MIPPGEGTGETAEKGHDIDYSLLPGPVDHEGRLWFAEYQGNAIGMFDPKTERISEWKVPTPWSALCLRLQRAAVCGAGGVMAWERGRGEGARGRGGR
jgi:hypothetical protein